MAGNKNSGRKGAMEEFKDVCLLTMTTSWLLNNFKDFTKEEKMKVALAIAPKGISEKHDVKGELILEVVNFKYIDENSSSK